MTLSLRDEPNERMACTPSSSPYFTIDRAQLAANINELRSSLGHCDLFYAVKANPEPDVLSTIGACGIGFEIASLHELELLGGVVPAERVLYGTAVKPANHVREAFVRGVRDFVADSPCEIDKIAAHAPGSNLLIRVRVDDSQSVFAFGEKFGASLDHVEWLVRYAAQRNVRPIGLSFHVGSQATRATAWADAVRTLTPVWMSLRAQGISLTVLNIGGGFPCQYDTEARVPTAQDIGDHLCPAVDELPGVRLIAEPGRFLVASAATLTANVIARVDRTDDSWLFLDAGCYNGLFEAMSYQGATRYPVTSLSDPVAGENHRFNIAGPTGDSADVIARQVALPASTCEGSTLVFHNVGAYTMSMSVPFNGFPKPAVQFT